MTTNSVTSNNWWCGTIFSVDPHELERLVPLDRRMTGAVCPKEKMDCFRFLKAMMKAICTSEKMDARKLHATIICHHGGERPKQEQMIQELASYCHWYSKRELETQGFIFTHVMPFASLTPQLSDQALHYRPVESPEFPKLQLCSVGMVAIASLHHYQDAHHGARALLAFEHEIRDLTGDLSRANQSDWEEIFSYLSEIAVQHLYRSSTYQSAAASIYNDIKVTTLSLLFSRPASQVEPFWNYPQLLLDPPGDYLYFEEREPNSPISFSALPPRGLTRTPSIRPATSNQFTPVTTTPTECEDLLDEMEDAGDQIPPELVKKL